MQDVRPSALAGRWYPANPAQLRQQIQGYLGEEVPPPKAIWGMLVPHAGLQFSGKVAGQAFRHLRHHQTVVVIAPSHYPYPSNLLSTAHTAFETPLGLIPVAVDLIQALRQQISLDLLREDPEHAIEIELPFLQVVLENGFQLLPLAMLDQSFEAAQALAEALIRVVGQGADILYVASSDLSHFYTQSHAEQLDGVIRRAIERYDPQGIIQAEKDGRGFACGRGAIAAVMLASGAKTAQVQAYATSGDVSGDYSRVVGYLSAMFCP